MADNKTGNEIKIVVKDGIAIAYSSGTVSKTKDIAHKWKANGPITYTQDQDDETNNKTKRQIAAAWTAFKSDSEIERVFKWSNAAPDATAIDTISEAYADAILSKIDAVRKIIKARAVRATELVVKPAAAEPNSVPETIHDSATIVNEQQPSGGAQMKIEADLQELNLDPVYGAS